MLEEEMDSAFGWVTIIVLILWQFLASVTVTVNVPAPNPETVIPDAPLFQLYVKAAVPPETVAKTLPVEVPKQATSDNTEALTTPPPVFPISAADVTVHPFASFTVTV